MPSPGRVLSRRRRAVPPPPADASETGDLLARFRDGDEGAFQELVHGFGPRLVQFFFRLCWDRDRAEDFTQELFLRLVRRAGSYRPEGRLATFIYRIATNLWIDHYRSTRPMPRLYSLDQPLRPDADVTLGAALPGDEPGPGERAALAEDKMRLRSALEGLNEPHRLVLELAVYQELPYAEIGSILDIPVGTVKSRMHNTVRVLRERLEAAADGGFRAAGGER